MTILADITHPLFRPVWVEGQNESRLGYVIELSYPASVVYVHGCGVVDVKNCKLHFLLGETHAKMRTYVYQVFDLANKQSTATTHVKVFA